MIKFYVNLTQNDVNDTKMDFFRCMVMLRAAEGGVYFFQILRGVFSKFSPARGYTTPTPLFPTPGYMLA